MSTEKLKAFGALLATVLTAAILIWWLAIVANRIGSKPELDSSGNIVLDEWSRAKEILLVIVPLFSAALAYWVGSQGTSDAKKEADSAKKRLDAVLDSSPEGVLQQAKSAHPDAFR